MTSTTMCHSYKVINHLRHIMKSKDVSIILAQLLTENHDTLRPDKHTQGPVKKLAA